VRNDVNRYLKWGFAEAANAIAVHRRLYPERHAVKLLWTPGLFGSEFGMDSRFL
jgi:hypothetical protein